MSGGNAARVGVPVQLAVDAAQAGEGNLEITVAARGLNIPTQVHPQVSIPTVFFLLGYIIQ